MIRPYKPSDLDQCLRIFKEVGWMDGKDHDKDIFAAYISDADSLVAELNGEVEVFVVTRSGNTLYQEIELPLSCVTGVVTSRVAR